MDIAMLQQFQTILSKMDFLAEKIERIEKIAEKRIITDSRKSMTITEACNELDKSRRTIGRLMIKGKLEIVPDSSPLKVTVRSVNKLK